MATAQIFLNLLNELEMGGFRDIAAIKSLGPRKGVYVG